MKRMIYKIWTFFMVGLLASCADDDTVWKDTGGGSIKLKFTDGLLVSRVADDTPSERAISHLDVFIYKTDGTEPIYERINNPVVTGADNAGTVTLNTPLSEFENRQANKVYVIANATGTFTGQETLDDLKAKVQEDRRIHVTGTTATGAPQYFLMDGQASSIENDTPGNITINHTSTDDIVMYVTLKRAAAKVVVTLTQSTGKYKFLKDETQNYEKGYYFRHMPYKTMLLEQTGTNAYPSDTYWRIPDKANDNAFEWCKDGENEVVVTAYVYSHQWKNEENEVHTKGTSLVVNIPLWYDTDNDGTVDDGEEVYMNSYYQLPIVNSVEIDGNDTWTINRNTLYTVTATIEAPGAEDNKQPHTLDNLRYTTEEWNPERVNVGGGNSPKYLELNKELVEMHNVVTDATLEFVSSSNVSVEVTEVFYNDKFGVKKTENKNIVTVTPDGGLTGSIKIDADVPTNNTIRYITLKVTNQDTGLEKIVYVQQYPLLYVTNQLGWYSYRDDFKDDDTKPTTFEYKGDAIRRVGLNSWNDYTKQWSYSYNDDYFWYSKVVRSTYTNSSYDSYIGRSDIDYYRWEGNSKSYSDAQNPGNARMYHVRVTATSFDYTVGTPAKTTDNYTNYEYTDPSEENSKLVSPSFMIASRLGFINTGSGTTLYKADTQEKRLAAFRDHCANYVEVAGDENNRIVYDDWRLPTEAELKIIMDLQGTESQSADAIDYLLNAVYYYSASGPVFNDKNDDNVSTEPENKDIGITSWSVRCVRDAYK